MQSVETEISIDAAITICHKVDKNNECEIFEYEKLLTFYNSWAGRSNYKGVALSEEQKLLLNTSLQKMWLTYFGSFQDRLSSTDPSKVITPCLKLMEWNYLSLNPAQYIEISYKLGAAYFKSGDIDDAKKILQTVADSSFGSSNSNIYRENAKKILEEIANPTGALSKQGQKEMFDMDEEDAEKTSDTHMEEDEQENQSESKKKPKKGSEAKSPKHRHKKEFSLEKYIESMEKHDSGKLSVLDLQKLKRKLNKEWEHYIEHSLQKAEDLYSDGKNSEAIDFTQKLLDFNYQWNTKLRYFRSNLYRIKGLSQNAQGNKEEALKSLEEAKNIKFTQEDKDGQYYKALQKEIDAIKNSSPSDTNTPPDSPTSSSSSTSSSSTSTMTASTANPSYSRLKRKLDKGNENNSNKSQKTNSDSNPTAREHSDEHSHSSDAEPEGQTRIGKILEAKKLVDEADAAAKVFQNRGRAYLTGRDVRETKVWEYLSDAGFEAAKKAKSSEEGRKMYDQFNATIKQYKPEGSEGFFKTAEYLNKLEGKDNEEYRQKLEGDKNDSSSSSMKNGQ